MILQSRAETAGCVEHMVMLKTSLVANMAEVSSLIKVYPVEILYANL
jgi:hypothetical protein